MLCLNSKLDMSKKYVSGSEAAKTLGISQPTLRKWADDGLLESIRTAGGHRRYDLASLKKDEIDIEDLNPEEEDTNDEKEPDRIKVCYCRVSTYGQKDDLDRQIKYMSNKYPTHKLITDVGSGINFNRKGLKKIIDYGIEGKLEELVCRIGYQLIEYILKTYSGTNIIVDNHEEQGINEEIAKDILEIITVYSAKIHGMRRYEKNDDFEE